MRAAFLGLAAFAAWPGLPAGAEEPLAFTVRPSGVEGLETLDQRLARRERGLRFICIGCVRSAGSPDEHPFDPVRTLNSPELSAALAAERRARVEEGR